jgi:RNA polymerase sigma factor (sigma-70 family)
MWGEMERSPVLAAPSFNNFIAANSTSKIGENEEEIQAHEANDLCERYRPLAFKIAGHYRDKGISLDDLRSAALTGLVLASRKFDPARDAFGPYAKPWIKGEITRLFKPTKDALAFGRFKSLDVSIEEGQTQALDLQADDSEPPILLNTSELTERERTVFLGRSRGETLRDLGSELAVSQERVRQVHAKATKKVVATPGNVARACIRDLLKRRGYEKPARPLLPYAPRTYPCHTYSPAEIDALVACRPDLTSEVGR